MTREKGTPPFAHRYEVLKDRVIHHMEYSLFPSWVGTARERLFKFEPGRFVPFEKDGTGQAAFAVWKKL